MGVRVEVRSISSDQRKAFVDAFLELKKQGRYDEYVHWHHEVMVPTVDATEPPHPDYRNGAHRGPSFLPWHRELLLQVEADLQKINAAITIPFWNWTIDSNLPDPHLSPVWNADLMGGNGVESDGWRVGVGPFAFAGGNWPIPEHHGGPALLRRFGFSIPTLPTPEDAALAMAEVFYDTPPYNSSPFTLGFRNRLEGWITQRGDSRVRVSGSQLHNRVHLWVGGSMLPMTSPNDPVFFLHHCFIDKLWADWQVRQDARWKDSGYSGSAPRYNPLSNGAQGHNASDILRPWGTHAIADVLDIATLGYSYEIAANQEHISMLAASLKPPTAFATQMPPFTAATSPFWAD